MPPVQLISADFSSSRPIWARPSATRARRGTLLATQQGQPQAPQPQAPRPQEEPMRPQAGASQGWDWAAPAPAPAPAAAETSLEDWDDYENNEDEYGAVYSAALREHGYSSPEDEAEANEEAAQADREVTRALGDAPASYCTPADGGPIGAQVTWIGGVKVIVPAPLAAAASHGSDGSSSSSSSGSDDGSAEGTGFVFTWKDAPQHLQEQQRQQQMYLRASVPKAEASYYDEWKDYEDDEGLDEQYTVEAYEEGYSSPEDEAEAAEEAALADREVTRALGDDAPDYCTKVASVQVAPPELQFDVNGQKVLLPPQIVVAAASGDAPPSWSDSDDDAVDPRVLLHGVQPATG